MFYLNLLPCLLNMLSIYQIKHAHVCDSLQTIWNIIKYNNIQGRNLDKFAVINTSEIRMKVNQLNLIHCELTESRLN